MSVKQRPAVFEVSPRGEDIMEDTARELLRHRGAAIRLALNSISYVTTVVSRQNRDERRTRKIRPICRTSELTSRRLCS